jgi:hypothetical protein
MKGLIHFTEPLPSNDRRDKHRDTETDGWDVLSTPLRWVQVPSFIKIGSGIQKLIRGIHRYTGIMVLA